MASCERPGIPSTLSETPLAQAASVAVEVERQSGLRIARHVSDLISPPMVALVTFWVLAAVHAGSTIWQVFLICGLTQTALPILYLKWAVRRGWIGDVDMSRREERRKGLPLLGLVYAAGALIAWGFGMPATIVAVCLCTLAVLAAIWTTNLFYKASGHVAGVSAYMTVLSLLGTSPLHAGLLLVPAIAWARVRSGAHTVAQTIWGFAIGTGLTVILFLTLFLPNVR
ncbi:MAG: hypothetical protein PVF43_12120 [Candidatus Eiseniibacteriota bacterium]